MDNREDHTHEILNVYPPRTEEEPWWCPQYGNVDIPDTWAFLPAGDPYVTRQAKLLGPHWVAKKHARGFNRTLGIWVPEENIEAALKQAEQTKAEREARRAVGRVYRERREDGYTKRFAEAIYRFLEFAPKYDRLARRIAREAAEHSTVVGSERVGRTSRLSLEEKAELAARAYIRHKHTKYEDRLEELTLSGLWIEPDDYLHREAKAAAGEEADEFLQRHRRQR